MKTLPGCDAVYELLVLRGRGAGDGEGELSAEESARLDAHLSVCAGCRREAAALRALDEALALDPAVAPSARLLAQARQGLDRALDREWEREQRGGWLRRMVLGNGYALRAAPYGVAAVLLLGVSAGSLGGYRAALRGRAGDGAPATPLISLQDAPVASVSGVDTQAGAKKVTVRYNVLVPASVTGSMDDPAIRHLLARGVESPTGPAVQDDSVRLLAAACAHGSRCEDPGVRGALMTAARYDGDAGLRSQALSGLEPYVTEDPRVRDAVLESLMRDASPEVRTQALNLLSPVEADSSVRQVLHSVSTSDQDPQIRSLSREALDVGMQIQ